MKEGGVKRLIFPLAAKMAKSNAAKGSSFVCIAGDEGGKDAATACLILPLV